MKKVILLALLVPAMAYGQIVENFEQGNTNNWVQSTTGRWKADGSEPLTGNFSLHHVFDNPDAGNDRIGLPLKNLHPSDGTTTWTFIVRHGYDPSSSNNWAVFLMSDAGPASMTLDGGANSYAIGVNITGSDDTLRLVKIKGSTVTTVVNCRINWQNNIGISTPVKIVIERSAGGNWTASVFRINGTLLKSSSGADSELFSTAWFGILYRYSSTRDRLLWMDDIAIDGNFYEDNAAPIVVSCIPSGRSSIEVVFSEPLADSSIFAENFSLNGQSGSATTIIRISEVKYFVQFSGAFKNKTSNNLVIHSLCDKAGNCTGDVQIPFTPVWAEAGDVVITEIMSDPVPEVALPPAEYLEITNRSDYTLNLKNWKLNSGDQSTIINEVSVREGEMLILCSQADTLLFKKFGRTCGLKQFPILTDGGKLIYLADSTGSLIHGVEYSSEWYRDELKKDGGWSLEMVDTGFPFSGEVNWKVSISRKGGTPGQVNSVAGSNPDNSFYGILNVFPEDSANIIVTFSEPVLTMKGNHDIIISDVKSLSSVEQADPLFRIFRLRPVSPLGQNHVYQIEIAGDIADFSGNPIQRKSYSFELTEDASESDILFNELLFNPFPGDNDYIELFNPSDKSIDLSDLQFVSVSETGDTSQLYQVSAVKRCFLPGTYYVSSVSPERTIDRYFSSVPENIFKSGSLPSMPDDKGHLILFNRQLDRIDEVRYSEKMHFSLLAGYEGVALEKRSPDLKSNDAASWHSAAENSGWGTPGAPNSIYTEFPAGADKVSFSSTKISPDSDGFEDFLEMHFSLTGSSNVITVSVFDETGRYVKKVANNLLAGPGTTILWDGTSADNSLVSSGIYVILITIFDDSGKTKQWKKACAVLR